MPNLPIIRPVFGPEEEQAVLAVLRSGWVAQGPQVQAFERKLAELAGAREAVACTSATTGLHLALVAAGIGPGDDVVVPSLSFIASTNAVWMAGARPVFADVAADLPVVTPESVAAVWTPQTRAVLAVHQLGMPCDRAGLRALCQGRGARLIEDAACALGTLVDGQPVTEGAELAVFSFHPRKVLTTGEGGAVTTDDPALAEKMRRLRSHGMTIAPDQRHGTGLREQFLEPAWNYRMTDVQAALGVVQLGRLAAIVARRQVGQAAYAEAFAQQLPQVRVLRAPAGVAWNVQTCCVRLPGPAGTRDRVLKALNDQGIGARRGLVAAHLEPAWQDHPRTDLPHSEAWADDALAVPLFDAMTADDVAVVVGAIAAALR